MNAPDQKRSNTQRIVLLSGGTGARELAKELARRPCSATHVLPMFDDGGSSRELRLRLGMPPPGDFRNRLMALCGPAASPELVALLGTRLPREGSREQLDAILQETADRPADGDADRRAAGWLNKFIAERPVDFDLRGGSIGNFVIAGAFLESGQFETAIDGFAELVDAQASVVPVCAGSNYHLQAWCADGTSIVGQSRITQDNREAVVRIAIVEPDGATWRAVRPSVSLQVRDALADADVICFAMGSFYTSLVATLLVDGMGQLVRESSASKVFVANLGSDVETHGMSASTMLLELARYLRATDTRSARIADYVNHVLVSDHGDDSGEGRIPVDVDRLKALGVAPIVRAVQGASPQTHHAPRVAAALLNLAQGCG